MVGSRDPLPGDTAASAKRSARKSARAATHRKTRLRCHRGANGRGETRGTVAIAGVDTLSGLGANSGTDTETDTGGFACSLTAGVPIGSNGDMKRNPRLASVSM